MPGSALELHHMQALAYRVPNKPSDNRPQGKPTYNYVVTVRTQLAAGTFITGVGEAQPRARLTGDTTHTRAWRFLNEALHQLHGQSLDASSPQAAVHSVRELYEGLLSCPAYNEERKKTLKPFRGTLMGVEIALLDLAARALNVTITDLLGGNAHEFLPLAPAVVSQRLGMETCRKRLRHQADRFLSVRAVGSGDPVQDLEFLTKISAYNASSSVGYPDKEIHLDLEGSLDSETCMTFLDSLAAQIQDGKISRNVMLEQPLPRKQTEQFIALLKEIDRLSEDLTPHGASITLVSDGTFWDIDDYMHSQASDAFPGINVRPAQAGGLLPALDFIQHATTDHASTQVQITRMIGASSLTRAALRSLGLATPSLKWTVADAAVENHMSISSADQPNGSGSLVGHGRSIVYDDIISAVKNHISAPAPATPTFHGLTANSYSDVEYLRPLGFQGAHGHVTEREALALGLSTVRYTKLDFIATDGEQEPLLFKASRWPLSSVVASSLTQHKEATRARLQRAGLPVPKGRTFGSAHHRAALEYAERLGYPVVVKPATGLKGIGVTADIKDSTELEGALHLLAKSPMGGDDFIVEKHVYGRDYRITVVRDEVVAAVLREPASVLGDGITTIAELMITKNMHRRLSPHLATLPLKYDESTKFRLDRSSLSLDYVPAEDQRVLLASSSNLAQGGDSIEVLDDLHPTIQEACVAAVRAIPGLAYCGVDILLEDHTVPITEQDAGICELNAHGALAVPEYPMFGPPRAVARRFLLECVEELELNVNAERADWLALNLIINGRVTGVGYREWFAKRARRFGLVGWIRNLGKRRVEAVVAGDTAPATALATGAILGPKDASPTSVVTTHWGLPVGDKFELLHDADGDF